MNKTLIQTSLEVSKAIVFFPAYLKAIIARS